MKRFEYIYTTLTLHKYRNNNYCTKYQQTGTKGVGFTTQKISKPRTQKQMLHRKLFFFCCLFVFCFQQKVIKWSKVVQYCCGRRPPPRCRTASPVSGTQPFQSVPVSNSRAEDETGCNSLVPSEDAAYCTSQTIRRAGETCYERMPHLEQNRSALHNVASAPPPTPQQGSWIPIWNLLICWIIFFFLCVLESFICIEQLL